MLRKNKRAAWKRESQKKEEYKTDRVKKIAGMSINNLCKLADHFGVSTDYLLGRTDVPAVEPDMQTAIKTTGLTEKAIRSISGQLYDCEMVELLSQILENEQFTCILVDICDMRSQTEWLDFLLDGVAHGKTEFNDIRHVYDLIRVEKHEIMEAFGEVVEEIAPSKGTLVKARDILNSKDYLSASDGLRAKRRRANNGERS